ncbi:hypothetical protein AAYR32_10775 [Streptococcus agalactiae]
MITHATENQLTGYEIKAQRVNDYIDNKGDGVPMVLSHYLYLHQLLKANAANT